MVEVLMRKDFGGLKPDSESAYKVLGKIGSGAVVTVDVKDPRRRSVKQNNLFHVLLNRAFDNQEYYPTVQMFRYALTVRLGYFEKFKFIDGEVIPVPKSLAFANMTHEEFSQFMDEAAAAIGGMLGMDKDELLAEVYS
jgi:hypothetical protein